MSRRSHGLTGTMRAALAGLAVLALAACQYADPNTTYPRSKPGGGGATYEPRESALGPQGLNLFGDSGPATEPDRGAGIAVNSYLWRASLDTVSFMPLASADPFGGVIITDWYTPPKARAERFKATIYILGRDLRADGVRAGIFRQVRVGDGTWVDANVEPKVSTEIENAILVRARQLRIAGLE